MSIKRQYWPDTCPLIRPLRPPRIPHLVATRGRVQRRRRPYHLPDEFPRELICGTGERYQFLQRRRGMALFQRTDLQRSCTPAVAVGGRRIVDGDGRARRRPPIRRDPRGSAIREHDQRFATAIACRPRTRRRYPDTLGVGSCRCRAFQHPARLEIAEVAKNGVHRR
jgi:hypothetical protein